MTKRYITLLIFPRFLPLLSLLLLTFLLSSSEARAQKQNPFRQVAKLYQEGNYNDALVLAKKILLEGPEADTDADSIELAALLETSSQSLNNLQRVSELDSLLEDVLKHRQKDWRIVRAASTIYRNQMHDGYILSGDFVRGYPRGGEVRYANSVQRDRVRSLQLSLQAISLAKGKASVDQLSQLYQELAEALVNVASWQLQAKTDLDVLPDVDDGASYGYARHSGNAFGAPVDEHGEAILYSRPDSFETAKSDGERWRYCLEQAAEVYPENRDSMRYRFYQFLDSQFGVRTLAEGISLFAESDGDGGSRSQMYSLRTLKDSETIARLATGIKRFSLPDEFNPIAILHSLADKKGPLRQTAIEELARIAEDRQQYRQAAEYWKQAIDLFGPGGSNERQHRLDQIVGAWGQFETTRTQAAGSPGTFEFTFRNATSVEFQAYRIEVRKLLDDVMNFLRSDPKEMDWQQLEINNIGYRLITENQQKYKGERVATWSEALTPREEHFSRRVTLKSPLKEGGAYLVAAKVAGGNTAYAVIWLNDTAIVRKNLDKGTLFFLADAKTGKPIPEMQLEFFGYKTEWHDRTLFGGRALSILTKTSSAQTDGNGQFLAANGSFDNSYQWLTIAKRKDAGEDRFAYLGFQGIWGGNYYDYEYNQRKAYGITDRPVYRPEQKVQYKVWVRHAKYDQEGDENANGKVNLLINDPKGEKLSQEVVTLDKFGGYEGVLTLKKDAPLGVYTISAPGVGGAVSFRVEEYKKPEFEVKVDAPSEPLLLGEKITATIRANYYFGAPVAKAKIHYKVSRSDTQTNWYPVGIWDWFYGPGYWWFAYDYKWFPGWRDWGCLSPRPWWIWSGHQNPPELLQDREVDIREDGTFPIEIDTTLAKELHGDTDHRYEITAEVVDDSRRTITGTGSVLVTRKPYKVYVWLDRGYYRSGEVIEAGLSAQTGDNKPVSGKGKATLYRLSYDASHQPQEKEIQSWMVDTNEQGSATLQMKAAKLGQYRLSYELKDARNHSVEGAYVFTVIGENFQAKDFRFNDIELVPEKKEYAPGDELRLQINTEQANSHVLLFLRPANGVYQQPQHLQLEGKSILKSIEIVKKDMPNFFIEAITVHDGRVYSQTKEIVVPPEKRVLNVEVEAPQKQFKPGEKATFRIKVRDLQGKPFSGSAVVAAYDKSVEYISGGSNVKEIKEFFWKWRRTHRSSGETNLMKEFANMSLPGEQAMSPIGVFGGTETDTNAVEEEQLAGAPTSRGFGSPRRQAKGMAFAGNMQPAAPAMAGKDGLADMLSQSEEKVSSDKKEKASGGAPAEAAGQDTGLASPAIRKEFADTAFWKGNLEVGDDGFATISFPMPENLTTWKIRAWVLGEGTRVGEGTVDVVTTKNLLLRLQAPRFFVEKDEVVLSANIHNYLSTKKSVTAKLELPGGELESLDETSKSVSIDAGGEQRVDWRVKVTKEGDAVVRMLALSDEESDAMEMHFPVYVHGMLKTDSFSGALRPEETKGSLAIRVPEERRVEQSVLELRYSPTLAGAMVDALPYLVNFPYGCTEQTLSRFLPTVITQKILKGMGLDLSDIREKRTNLNAQEIGEGNERAKQWKRYAINPVFDEATVNEMASAGVARLAAMQLSGGGWGWFSGYGETPSAHLTAHVVHGLQIATANGLSLPNQMLANGISYLKGYEAGELQKLKNAPTKTEPYKSQADELDAFVHMVLLDADSGNAAMREFLYRDRNSMSLYAKSIQGLIFHKVSDTEKVKMLRQNIEQFLVEDKENQTAYLNLGNEGYWWYWYGSEYEAHAYYLKLLAAIEPKGEIAPKLVKYLLNNRKNATYWNSTRDTAIILEAFADFLKGSNEMKPDLDIEIFLDGKKQKEVHVDKSNLFTFENRFVLVGSEVPSGSHTIELRKKGQGPLYYNAYLTNFTLEDPITKAGLEVKVERKYYKLVKDESATALARGEHGQALTQKTEKYRREPLASSSTLTSGDLVEIELEIESKNDYEYLVFEDMKPAGFEPLEVQSGYNGNAMGAYVEFRDERVAFFVRALPRGKRSVSYKMRAEIPGSFSALPTRASAMYAPEIRANSDEYKVGVKDKSQ